MAKLRGNEIPPIVQCISQGVLVDLVAFPHEIFVVGRFDEVTTDGLQIAYMARRAESDVPWIEAFDLLILASKLAFAEALFRTVKKGNRYLSRAFVEAEKHRDLVFNGRVRTVVPHLLPIQPGGLQ